MDNSAPKEHRFSDPRLQVAAIRRKMTGRIYTKCSNYLIRFGTSIL
ncbi:MAG: hypothetical protein ACQERO_05215 [Bacteroidota bacterium]